MRTSPATAPLGNAELGLLTPSPGPLALTLALLWTPGMSYFPWLDVVHSQMASTFRGPAPSPFMETGSPEWL